jgi:hypothetical protein
MTSIDRLIARVRRDRRLRATGLILGLLHAVVLVMAIVESQSVGGSAVGWVIFWVTAALVDVPPGLLGRIDTSDDAGVGPRQGLRQGALHPRHVACQSLPIPEHRSPKKDDEDFEEEIHGGLMSIGRALGNHDPRTPGCADNTFRSERTSPLSCAEVVSFGVLVALGGVWMLRCLDTFTNLQSACGSVHVAARWTGAS